MTALCCIISEYVLSNEEKSKMFGIVFSSMHLIIIEIIFLDFWNIGIIITADSDIETAWWLVALTHALTRQQGAWWYSVVLCYCVACVRRRSSAAGLLRVACCSFFISSSH
jgi:hypothetical protein